MFQATSGKHHCDIQIPEHKVEVDSWYESQGPELNVDGSTLHIAEVFTEISVVKWWTFQNLPPGDTAHLHLGISVWLGGFQFHWNHLVLYMSDKLSIILYMPVNQCHATYFWQPLCIGPFSSYHNEQVKENQYSVYWGNVTCNIYKRNLGQKAMLLSTQIQT